MLRELSVILGTSLLFSLGFVWLGQPSLLGYIASGIFLGPFIKLIEHPVEISLLGHLGMLMMLFIVGLEFDLVKFRKIWKKALAIVFLQIVVSFILAFGLRPIFRMTIEYSFLIAFLFTLSSTAIVVKLLEEMDEFNSSRGSLIVSILIVQDFMLVPMMLILKSFGTHGGMFAICKNLFISVGLLVGLIFYLGKESNKLLKPLKSIFQGNQETMTLASVAICFGFATIAAMFGLSAAYGAFLAGLILGSFGNKRDILQFALPISSLLIMIFFISIGSQLNIDYIRNNWLTLGIISVSLLLGKILMNYVILRTLNCSIKKSLFVSIVLSQVSEFSFTLISILRRSHALDVAQVDMLNSLAMISLTVGAIFPVLSQLLFREFIRKKTSKSNNIQ